jgi:hypothetical protein
MITAIKAGQFEIVADIWSSRATAVPLAMASASRPQPFRTTSGPCS